MNRKKEAAEELKFHIITKAIFMSNMEPENFNKSLKDYNKMTQVLYELNHPEEKIKRKKFEKSNIDILKTFKGKNLTEFLGKSIKLNPQNEIKKDFEKTIKNWSKV